MKHIFYFGLISFLLFSVACNDDEQPVVEDIFEYHAHIHSPNLDNKHKGDTIHIEVNFESHTGMPVHHIGVRIYNKADNSIVAYDQPSEHHVHAISGEYLYEDDLILSDDNGFNMHGDWIMEAKVWGHEAGLGEEIETIEFHVHPM